MVNFKTTVRGPQYETIEIDGSLGLAQLQLSDAERLFELVDESRVYLAEYLPWVDHTLTVDDSREFIERMQRMRASGEEYGYAIKLDGEIVGHMSLMHLSDDAQPEIGYWIGKDYSSRGVVTKAVLALGEFGFGSLALPEIIIRADVNNAASNRVAEKAGYTIKSQQNEEGRTLNVWSRRV